LRRRLLSVDLKKEHDRVARLSVTDDVSGFQNTRYLHRYLDKYFDSPKARERKLSLAFFDIDSFKEVVDTHGHLLGAKVLREIAQAVNRTLDSDDRIVRYGGDEYVVILPDQDKADAALKVEKMREAIKETAFLQKEGCYVRVTASFGLATAPNDGFSPEDLLGAADECLFKSKRAGKDRITTVTVGQPARELSLGCETLETVEAPA
jgi:diguanylate cyclase (GGDEF)-like protein